MPSITPSPLQRPFACFPMLGPGLFTAVARSATPLRQSGINYLWNSPYADLIQSINQSIRNCLCSRATSRLIVCIRNVQLIMSGYDFCWQKSLMILTTYFCLVLNYGVGTCDQHNKRDDADRLTRWRACCGFVVDTNQGNDFVYQTVVC